jgi:DNA ligase-1
VIEVEGPAGLKAISLRPLSAASPMLAGGEGAARLAFPVYFEKKYDGVRLMVHKATSPEGRVRTAAFTRRRLDWSELVPGIDALARSLPCRDAILDGELHGTVQSPAGPRPSSVYDIVRFVRGERVDAPVRLRFSAFDILYLDGQDLTARPFHERRAHLARLAQAVALIPLPLPLELSDGELVHAELDMKRLYELFRAQGYEGGIAKDLASTYELGKRSNAWWKMKPAVTLDLAITGALYATSAEARGAQFGTYLVSALAQGPSLAEVGRVQGLSVLESQEVIRSILDEGLLTGRTIERETSTGKKAGIELRPGLVATVRFEGIVKGEDGRLALRDPKIVRVRMTEGDLDEVDRVSAIEDLWMKQGYR